MIVTVIPISTDNAARAEFCLDWLLQLNLREKRGHALLVFDGVHSELVDRIKITAELVFESFDALIPPSKDTKEKMASAIVRRNNLFMNAAEYCQRVFRCPFLFLEPESVPTNPQWMENIENLWEAQPRRYLLTHLRDTQESPRFPASVGVYHMGFWGDVAKAYSDPTNAEVPWERIAGESIVSRSTKCRAFQPLRITDEGDFSKVWPEAQIVSSDPTGAFIEKLRADGVHLPPKGDWLKAEMDTRLTNPSKPPGFGWTRTEQPIQPRITPDPPNLPPQLTQPNPRCETTKPDLRTKAGREWKAAHANGNGH